MNEQNTTEMNWWRRNRKRVLIIGGAAAALGIGFVAFYKKDTLLELITREKVIAKDIPRLEGSAVVDTSSDLLTVAKTEAVVVRTPINNGIPFPVKGYIREIPEGWHASAEKLAQAGKLGIELREHQTLVNPFMKNVA